jgi:GNAT superfamily N-acetyltransferase
MILKAFSSRYDISISNLNNEFINSVDEMEKYSFIGGFVLYDDDTDEILATVSGMFFDEDKILNENEDIVDIADMIDADVYGAMSVLSKNKIHNQEVNDEKMFLSLFSCYIQRIYVYPKYRKTGIAHYIFSNLEQIFLHCFNTPIHSFVIFPKPQQPNGKNAWENSPDNDGTMLKRMKKLLKINNFTQIGKTGYYIKNYAAD